MGWAVLLTTNDPFPGSWGSLRPPEPELLAADHHGHLIEMPLRSWAPAMAAKLSSKQRSELQHPASDKRQVRLQPTLKQSIASLV